MIRVMDSILIITHLWLLRLIYLLNFYFLTLSSKSKDFILKISFCWYCMSYWSCLGLLELFDKLGSMKLSKL